MWLDAQERIKALMESTRVNANELAQVVSEQTGTVVHRSEVSHALNDSRGDTPKGRQILRVSLSYLTEVQENQTKEMRAALNRAQKALDAAN